MKDKILKVLSYILVAAMASAVSCGLMVKEVAKQNTKLNQLSRLIEERFIGEADMTQAEDAAAAAMVDSLGDKWSYLQQYKFGANAQPFYVLVDHEGKPLNQSYSYDEDIDKFVQFLDKGKDAFDNKK